MKNLLIVFALLMTMVCCTTEADRNRMRANLDSINQRNRTDLPFTVQELRAYETRKKLQNRKEDVPIDEDEPLEEQAEYWLLDRGWENDEDEMKAAAVGHMD